MIKNYFVCIGAQKAGTTWLAAVLSKHPDIFVTPVKEIHYFDHIRGITDHLNRRRCRSRYRKYFQRFLTQWSRFNDHRQQWSWYHDYMKLPIDDAWYASLFNHRGKARFAGEATPEYALLEAEGFRHIQRLAPSARLIYIMRNPVTRAWSQILHSCRSNGLDVGKQKEEDLHRLISTKRFLDLGNYEKLLNELAEVFPENQICLEFYEDIHQDRTAAFERICGFIGIETQIEILPDLEVRHNPSQKGEMPEPVRRFLRERYRPMVAALEKRMERFPESWIREFML